MYRVIGGDLKEYGPATLEEVEHWIHDGRLNGQCLGRLESSSDWRPLSGFPEFGAALKAQSEAYPQAAAAVSGPPPDLEGRVDAGFAKLRVRDCTARGWELLRSNFSLLFAATFLVWMTGLVSQFVPLAGILYWLLHGVFEGGLFLVFIKRLRGEPAAVSDVFGGFGPAFRHLVLVGVLTSALSWLGLLLFIVPGIFLYVVWAFAIPLAADKRTDFWTAMEASRKVVMRIWPRVLLLLAVAFLPALLARLASELQISLSLYPEMREILTARPFDMQKLSDLLRRTAVSSFPLVLLAKFVLLLNLPFALATVACAYETLFGTRPARRP